LVAPFVAVDLLPADDLAVDLPVVAFLAVAVFAEAAFDAGFVGLGLLAIDALVVGFLGAVRRELVFARARADSIVAVPGAGANRLSCPSLHRTRKSTPSSTSTISFPERPAGSPRFDDDAIALPGP